MAAPDAQDPHKNNLGVQIGSETDYLSWDWRKILVAITGSVNTDQNTAADKLPTTSSPQTFYDSAGYFDTAKNALSNAYNNLKKGSDRLVGVDNPTWTGDAADAFKGLMAKTLGAVKSHADPLAGPPSYAQTMNAAGDALLNAINTANTQNYNAAKQVIDRWNSETVPDVQSTDGSGDYFPSQPGNKGDPPWYDYNGTTIVMISHYPDIDQQLSKDMRNTLQTLVQAYRGFTTDMPEPTGQLPNPAANTPPPAPTKINIPPIKFDKQPPPPNQPPPPKQQPPPTLDPKNQANGGVGPNGQPLGPDGNQPAGAVPNLAKPNGPTTPNLVSTPNGPALVGPDGKTLLDPNTGNPLTGPDGKPLTLNKPQQNPVLIPPPGGLTPPGGVGGVKSPNLKAPAFKTPPGVEFGKPPNLNSLVSGGPPARPGSLASDGPLKPGANEIGAAGGSAGSRGEPLPMGGGAGMAGAASERDRDRTTWLVEDEEVWGAGTTLGFGVLGR